MNGTSATARKSRARYRFEKWNSRIGCRTAQIVGTT